MRRPFVCLGPGAAAVLALSALAIGCGASPVDTGAGGDQGGQGGASPTGSGGTSASGSGGSTATGSGGQSGGTTGAGGATATGRGGTTGSGGAPSGCAGTLMKCNGVCVDTTGSQTNCGGCGVTCRADMQCWQSGCRCPTGQADCGGVCKDVTSTSTNCGTCGNVCATGATCVNAVCQCPTDQLACSGTCRAVLTDAQNCGKCGMVCGAGTSCLFGGCLDPSSLACSPSAQANSSSTRDASIILGKYWVNNNWWGASAGSGSNTIWSTCQQGDLIGWGTSWNWSGTANQVKSYASVVLGWQWGWKTRGTGLPILLSSGKKITCGWDFTVTQTGGAANVAYDMFLHNLSQAPTGDPPNAPGTNTDPTDEIMVWLYRANGAGPVGTKQTTTPVTLAGTGWDLYRGTITNSSNGTSWNVFSYIRTMNATTSSMNMMEFFNDLVARGWVAGSKYLTSVQAGSEIFTGMGRLDTKGYTCRVQ